MSIYKEEPIVSGSLFAGLVIKILNPFKTYFAICVPFFLMTDPML